MKKYLEKKVRKYVIATLSHSYLGRNSVSNTYYFTDIIGASKYNSYKMAKTWINLYRQDTRDLELDLLIIPVDISYELIDESDLYMDKELN